jgi:hypothetical protein
MDDSLLRETMNEHEELIHVLIGIRGALWRLADAMEVQNVRTQEAGDLVASATRSVAEELERQS